LEEDLLSNLQELKKHTWCKFKRMALLLYVNLIQKRRYSAIGLDLQRKDLAGFEKTAFSLRGLARARFKSVISRTDSLTLN